MFAFSFIFVCILDVTFGQIAVKTGMNQIERIESLQGLFKLETLLRIFTNPWAIVGLLCTCTDCGDPVAGSYVHLGCEFYVSPA